MERLEHLAAPNHSGPPGGNSIIVIRQMALRRQLVFLPGIVRAIFNQKLQPCFWFFLNVDSNVTTATIADTTPDRSPTQSMQR
jgi:hypothetical protein